MCIGVVSEKLCKSEADCWTSQPTRRWCATQRRPRDGGARRDGASGQRDGGARRDRVVWLAQVSAAVWLTAPSSCTSRLEAPACIPCIQRYRENGSSDLRAKTHLVAVLFDTVHKGMLPSVWPRCVGAALLEGDPAHNRGSQAAMADMPCIEQFGACYSNLLANTGRAAFLGHI